MQVLLQAVPRRREQAAMEALSGSASLDDFLQKIEAADWAGCDAHAFARAAAAKLVTLSKSEKYSADTEGEKARVKGIYDLRPSKACQLEGGGGTHHLSPGFAC